MFKLPIPTRLTDYLGEAVVWTVIIVWADAEIIALWEPILPGMRRKYFGELPQITFFARVYWALWCYLKNLPAPIYVAYAGIIVDEVFILHILIYIYIYIYYSLVLDAQLYSLYTRNRLILSPVCPWLWQVGSECPYIVAWNTYYDTDSRVFLSCSQ